MNRLARVLLLTLLPSTALATDLRLYPTFTEVQQPLTSQALTFPSAQWRWIQPASFSVLGPSGVTFSLYPEELEWLRTQEGQAVTWRPAGQPPVPATLARADDLLLKLNTGEFVHAPRSELAFPTAPPVQGGVTFRLSASASSGARLSYRTQALFWTPRYELNLSGAAANLSALAQINNLSDQVFTAGQVDLFGGTVRQVQGNSVPTPVNALPFAAGSNTEAVRVLPGASTGGAGQISLVGEVRGLQRYALPGGLTIGRGEQRTLPFLKPQVSGFTRYASVQSYFDAQNRSGQVDRHYKFTSSLSLPAGAVDVREGGLLVGSVTLPAAQAGKPVDLNLGADPELRYEKVVKRLGQEKNSAGQIVSTTSQVTYTFVSGKATAMRVTVREQLYGRTVAVDGNTAQNGQVSLTRQVEVPARGKATLTFKLKILN
ncbi:hypothetical protein [Deinococcus arcticus]|uniref:DUF4139 domain-containing protein n=1 Tax=Deinococcus arcticus TaxID=2136176 RepID=A0A2T3W4I4_9DEIO|nr:hypothetical protein [Deinococcus arcticus]PTA66782.1 hypothetical protein C8263_16280 [Deinococcus arcticus]